MNKWCCAEPRTHPISSIPPQFEHCLVRLEDVQSYFSTEEMQRKRQLTFQFEILFLCFFIPFCLQFIFPFDQGAYNVLAETPFPLFPPSDNAQELPNSIRMHRLGAGYFSDEEGFWQWMNNVLFYQVFVEGENATSVGKTTSTPYSSRAISQPVVIGQVRIRQIRVKPQPCPQNMGNSSAMQCYPAFSPKVMETSPFGENNEFQYVANTGELEFPGKLFVYPSSGYVTDLTSNSQLLALRASFDLKSTACVIITMSTFDPNSGMVTNIRIGVEFSNSGSTITTHTLVSKALYYRTSSALLTMQVLQVLVLLSEFCYVGFQLKEIGVFRSNPLSRIHVESPFWFAVDCIQLALVVYISALCIPFLFMDANQDLAEQISQRQFFNGQGLSQLSVTMLEVSGVILWIGTLIVFKSTEYFKSMRLWHQVMNRIAWDAFIFFLFIAVFCLGFVLCAWVVFGPASERFSSFGRAAFSVMNMLVLVVDYDNVARIQPFGYAIAPVFFVPFLLFFTWYLFCVLVGIVYLRYKQEKMAREECKLRERKWVRAAIKLGARRMVDAQPIPPSLWRLALGWPARRGYVSNSHMIEQLQALDQRKQCFISFPRLIELMRDKVNTEEEEEEAEEEREEEEENNSVIEGGSATGGTAAEAVEQYQAEEDVDDFAMTADTRSKASEETARSRAYRASVAEETEAPTIADEEDAERNLHRTTSYQSFTHGPPQPSPQHYHPLVCQAMQVFQHMYLIPKQRPEVLSAFYNLEEVMLGGEVQAKRATLVKLQAAFGAMNRESTESKNAVMDRLKSLRVEQRNLTDEILELRRILKQQ